MVAIFKRNIKEWIRDPLVLVFFIIFPTLLFIIMQLIFSSIGIDVAQVPQFEISHFTISMILFSFSFISIFMGTTLASDKETSLMMRIRITPIKSFSLFLGYLLSVLPFVIVQEVLMIVLGFCFGLSFKLEILYVFLLMAPFSLLFIGCGMIGGLFLNSRSVSGVSSILPTCVGIFGGVFMPLDIMEGTFKDICYILPFANEITFTFDIYNGKVPTLSMGILSYIYPIVILALAFILFNVQRKRDII